MNFFGVSPGEAGVVLVIALIVIGPHRFPEIMRNAGRWYRVARAYSDEVMKDVRAAVGEIEKEVNAETGDLKSVREFGKELTAELKDTQQSVESVGKDTQAAAQATNTPAPSTPATTEAPTKPAPSVRPSHRAVQDAKAAQAASPDPVTPPASFYEGRDPSTYDPFKAKEAREGGNTPSTNTDKPNADKPPTNTSNSNAGSNGTGSTNGTNSAT